MDQDPAGLAPGVRETTQASRDKLARLAQAAELTNDPMAPLLSGLEITLGALCEVTDEARQPLDKASVAEIGAVLAGGVREEHRRLAVAEDRGRRRRERLWVAGVVLALGLGCGAAGYGLRAWEDAGAVRETEAGLRAAFADGLPGAQIWRDLIQFNPSITEAISRCEKVKISDRSACKVPLWLTPSPAPRGTAGSSS
jgi:hypothetical protein